MKMNIQTVLGVITPESLGFTLGHEHLSTDFEQLFCSAPPALQNYVTDKEKITLENLGVLRQYPYSSRFNLNLSDEESHKSVIEDVKLFKKWGGGSIVENTSYGIKRDLLFCRRVAQETGVNVIAGTGHYAAFLQTESDIALSVEALTNLYSQEILTGVDVSGNGKDLIKCGFVGEVGSKWPLIDFERKTIQATAEVQDAIGCGVSFHPGRHPHAPFEIVRLYLEAGGKAHKCVMSHVDRTFNDLERLVEFAKLGVYLQFDKFGVECSYYQFSTEYDMPSDSQRMDQIARLVKEGYEDQILISQDIHTKHRLMKYGGHGYSHIIHNVLPKLQTKGLTQEQIEKLTVTNAANWLQFNA